MADVPSINAAQAIAASALRAQQGRMRIIAENLANANSTAKTKGGTPYQRQEPVFEPTPVAGDRAGGTWSRPSPAARAAARSTNTPRSDPSASPMTVRQSNSAADSSGSAPRASSHASTSARS